jgi:hypothetical protein
LRRAVGIDVVDLARLVAPAKLKFRDVRAGQLRLPDQLICKIHVSVVIHADLGDEQHLASG